MMALYYALTFHTLVFDYWQIYGHVSTPGFSCDARLDRRNRSLKAGYLLHLLPRLLAYFPL